MSEIDPRLTKRDDWDLFKFYRVDDTKVPMSLEQVTHDGEQLFDAKLLNPADLFERFGPGRFKAGLFRMLDGTLLYRTMTGGFVLDDIGGITRIVPRSERRKGNVTGTVPFKEDVKTGSVAPEMSGQVGEMRAPTAQDGRNFAPPTPPAARLRTPHAGPPPMGAENPMEMFGWMVKVMETERIRAQEDLDERRRQDRLDNEERVARVREDARLQLQQAQTFYEAMTKLTRASSSREDSGATENALASLQRDLREMREQLEDRDDEEDTRRSTAKQTDLAMAVTAVKDLLTPVIPVILEKIVNGASRTNVSHALNSPK